MKLVVLYRPNSEYATKVEQYMHEFARLHPDNETEILDLDSLEGSAKARLYDVVDYPALLIIDNQGKPIALWSGSELPLMNEVAGYLSS